jgi:hypothetical protein
MSVYRKVVSAGYPADYPAPRVFNHTAENSWVWARLSDEQLEICLQDFVWLSQFGDEPYRPDCTRIRDQISAECLRRGRIDIERRAWMRGLAAH